MRIGYNALASENRSGTGRYTAEVLLALARIGRDHEWEVCLHEDSPLRVRLAMAANMRLHPVVRGGRAARVLFETGRLTGWIRRHDLDVFHGPAFTLPPRCPAPAVVTVHDLVFRLFPRTVAWSRRPWYRFAIPRSMRQAAVILADSEAAAEDIRTHYPDLASRVRAAPLGVDERFFEIPSPEHLEEVRRRYGLPERYVLTTGTMEPRKNLPLLLKAYAGLIARHSEAPDLVVVGREGWGMKAFREALWREGLVGRVRLPGFAREEDLPGLYAGADLFVCVSLHEGFGLPVLEAMACGTPVVASKTSSLPEVVGDAGRLVPPADADVVAEAMSLALSAPEETRRLAAAARERARTFTWEATARRVLAACVEAAGRR